MKRKIVLLFLFLLTNTLAFSQNNLNDTIRNYQISICGTPQRISLIEFNDSTYKGYIISSGYKYKDKYSFKSNFNKKYTEINLKGQKVVDTIELDSKKARSLIKKLKKKGIETLQKENPKKYKYNAKTKENELILFLHSCSTVFRVKTKNINSKISFEEINYISEDSERIKAQILYSILTKEIDFEKYWENYMDRIKQ